MFDLINTHLFPIGLRNPTLEILEQNEHQYSMLLYQPKEQIEYGDSFIRNANNASASEKFRAFFHMADENQVGLAVTPEYSCPWNVMAELIENNLFPREDKLWIIGCESIKAAELMTLIEENPQISWVTDSELIDANLGNNHFFNPACYIFRTRAIENNALQTVVVVQFKTSPLGGEALVWERDNFIHGRRIYIIENRNESSRLATLICSDALNQALIVNNMPGFINIPYLIVHIQLNQAPNNISFRRYRGDTYNLGRYNKEFICLNWSSNLTLGQYNNWNQYGGSALYMKVENDRYPDTSDLRLRSNQKLGLYYTRWAERYANIFFLNYAEHVFLLRTTKVSQENAAIQQRQRTGPEMLGVYSWEDGQWANKPAVDDGFADVCASLHQIGDFAGLLAKNDTNPIDVERIVCLTVGKGIEKGWHTPLKLSFLRVDDTEICKKITFTQTPCNETRSNRKTYLINYGVLAFRIITNPINIPDNIKDLRENCRVSYREEGFGEQYNLNLYPLNGDGSPATGVFIGTNTIDSAQEILFKLIDLFSEDHFGKRVVVWYHDADGNVCSEFSPDPPKINDNTSQSTRSIRKTSTK